MKKILLLLLLSCCGFLAAAEPATNYRDAANWVICEADKPETEFDVFYVYPTLFADQKQPLMSWSDNPRLRAKTVGFARAQTGIFGNRARVFAPFVRQLDYTRCVPVLQPGIDWRKNEAFAPGVADTQAAFRYYLKHFNGGRPYILFGHSQGSTDLYLMMLTTPEVAAGRGFAAAYLIGLPHLSARDIAADFGRRGIAPATGAEDVGVIIGWNSQAPGADNPSFTGDGTFCINPLNWRTDGTPAEKTAHAGAFFYDYRTKKSKIVPHFCGARIDTARGALLVDLPVNGEYDARGFMGSGVYHMNDVWFFAGNLRDNAALRVRMWKNLYREK